jgi:hypothetical protein
MDHGETPSALLVSADMREYFHGSISTALRNQHLKANEATANYLVNLLCCFSRTDDLFERSSDGTTSLSLADLYAHALTSNSKAQRQQFLQRLGDVALFISGIFTDSLNRKIVDIDYYIAMGGNAYGYLSASFRTSSNVTAARAVFADLSERFHAFVDILNEVSEHAHLTKADDILRLYEIWLRTGSQRAGARLRRLGITPATGSSSRSHH